MSDRVLVDSSAWGDFLRGRGRQSEEVLRLVASDQVWLHPTVVGEVFLGGVDLTDGRLGDLSGLRPLPTADVLGWVKRQPRVSLRGVGWADCEIVHAAVTHGVDLLTSDLAQAALFSAARRAT